MKKIRRVLALMLVLVMSLSVLGGCSKNTKQTMFTVMEDAASLTHYSYEVNMNLKSSMDNLDNMTIKLTGETDGEAATMGIKVSYLYFTVGVNDFITITKDAIYLNVEEIFSALAPMLLGTEISLADLEEELGVELKSVQIPLIDGMVSFDKNEDFSKLMNSILETALKDVKIESDKSTYTAKIEGVEALSKVADAYLTGILDNRETIISALNEQNKLDENTMKDMLNLYMNEIIAALERFNADYEMGYTEEDIAGLRKNVEEEFEAAIQEADLGNVSSAYDEAFDSLEEQKDEIISSIADSEGVNSVLEITDSMTGKEGSRVYECEVNVEVEDTANDEDLKLNISMVMTEDKDISVKAPEKYTSMSDLIYAVLVYAYENDMLDEDILYDSYLDSSLFDTELGNDTESGISSDKYINSAYDGSVIVTDIVTEDEVTIEFDKDVLTVDDYYGDPDYGNLCLCAVDDRWCNMFMIYDSGKSAESMYEYLKEYYNDPEFFSDVQFTDLTTRNNGDVMIYEFDLKYKSSDYDFNERYFIVEADKGVIYGYADMNYDFAEDSDSILSYEEFINAAFLSVH